MAVWHSGHSVRLKTRTFVDSNPTGVVPLLHHGPPFSNYYFLVHHPVNRDDQPLLACAMVSDFSVEWQRKWDFIV
jgi:hypothetical protein